jgi:hypothetical protein
MIFNIYVQNKNHQGKTPKPMVFQVDDTDHDAARQYLVSELQSVPQRVLMEIPKEKQ